MNSTELRVLFRDESILAIDKPGGILSVPGRDLNEPSISELAKELAPDALTVHRLDRETSGVLIFALGKASLRALGLSFETRKVEKKYLALCRGRLESKTSCALPLTPWTMGRVKVAQENEEGALPASTELIPIDRFDSATLIECRPRSGRTHQIRVHLAALDHPLLVDERYGSAEPITARALDPQAADDSIVLSRTPLHAASLRLPHPGGSGFLSIESPTPADLARCLELLRASRRRSPA